MPEDQAAETADSANALQTEASAGDEIATELPPEAAGEPNLESEAESAPVPESADDASKVSEKRDETNS